MDKHKANDLERSKSIMALILEISISDHDLSEEEKQYIYYAAGQYNLSPNDLQDVLLNPKSFHLQPPASEKERMEILYHLMFIMRADGMVLKDEETLVQKAGFYLGFDE